MEIVPFGKTDLGPAAQTLVEKITGAIGTVYEPIDKIFHAWADVEVDKIKAAGEFEVEGVRRRALERLAAEETKKQQNLEAVYGKTYQLLEPELDPSKINQMDDDWIVYHSENARLVSNEEMQTLWANVLAREAEAPGSFSKRTLDALSVLEKSDAHLFTTLCRFAVRQDGVYIPAVRYIERQGFPGYWAPIHTNQGIDHNSLIHLSSIGLVVYSGGFLTPNVRLYETPDFEVEYFGDRRTFATSDRDEQKGKYFAVYGYADLTDIGRQLARIAGATPVEGFFDFLESEWAKARITRVS